VGQKSKQNKLKFFLSNERKDQIWKSQDIWDWLVHPPQSGG